ncbi:hypothetical protein LCGC14_1583860 [marine sediment metagenome]|uniref:Uncharacterized protein n=1 Tax=marine sediment metagenome TaxID=412755 RepID=A0A0F9IGB2_9ZZZZ
MNKLKVNRTHFVSLDNIDKFLIKKNGDVWVYLKTGFPSILKCLEGAYMLRKRLVNCGVTIHEFKVEEE